MVVFDQGVFLLWWSFIRVVFYCCGLSSGWSFTVVLFDQGGLSVWWTLIRVVYLCGGL